MPTAVASSPSAFVVKESVDPAFVYRIERPLVRRKLNESSRRYGTSKRPPGPEAILHMAWRNAGLERAQVCGRDGHTYSIVYGGKPGGSLGPDFTDAVVERDDGTTFRGDIEIHVRESDWRSHGHHTDPRYNGVVLHVVASESNGKPALKATGSTIPLLALNWKRPLGAAANTDNHTSNLPTEIEKPELPVRAAGLDRFHSQAAGIALEIETFGADQAIWLGVLGALGYPRNKRAFRAVAGRVDWQIAAANSDPAALQELLVYAAGLNDSPASAQIRSIHLRGSAPGWVRPFGRPTNSPQARIMAISHLAPLWAKSGGISQFAKTTVASADAPKDLSLMFRPLELVKAKDVTVLGTARAAEIVVNVLLPAVFAMATIEHQSNLDATHLKNHGLKLYSTHPKLSSNSVTKEAEIALGIDFSVPKIASARDQQGLIALYREMFRHGIRTRQPRLPGV